MVDLMEGWLNMKCIDLTVCVSGWRVGWENV